jgi:hypothetical protein
MSKDVQVGEVIKGPAVSVALLQKKEIQEIFEQKRER